MKQGICLVVATLGLGLWASGWQTNRPAAFAAPSLPVSMGSSGLITHVQEIEGKLLRMVVVDPVQRVMGVYDIGRDSGEIQPKSIRNFNADFQMLEFNSDEPSPADIQGSLERK